MPIKIIDNSGKLIRGNTANYVLVDDNDMSVRFTSDTSELTESTVGTDNLITMEISVEEQVL
jgi:hypothetical protein